MKIFSKFKLILISLLCLFEPIYCQEWIKTFDIQNHIDPTKVIESYDRGIILGANIAYGNHWSIGWIIKMDVNGNVLWEKKLGEGSNIWQVNCIDTTTNGGLIVAGTCDTVDVLEDPYVLKLNSCGEIEWCRIYHSENIHDYGRQVITLPDETFLVVIHILGDSPVVQLNHIDTDGDIIWEKYYFPFSSLGYPLWEYNITITPDNQYLISGTCYHTIDGQTLPQWVWPMLIMADSTGESDWELPWGYTLPFGTQIRGEGFRSLQINNTIFTTMSNYHWPNAGFYSPCLIKTCSEGVELSYKDLIENTDYGKASTITKLNDTTLIIGSWYNKQSFQGLSILKTDTNGHVLKEKVLNNSEYYPSEATLTKDRKYLVTASDWVNYSIMHLWKLNENLEYDSIYTVPRTYDSLCPYPITSSTLFSTCDLATSVQEPAWNTERVRMRVYPNPASSALHVGLPEAIQKNSATAHLQVSTVFHRWNKLLWLTASDMFGREVFRKEVYLQEKEIRLDVTAWPSGLYLLRLSDSNSTVAEEKVVVE